MSALALAAPCAAPPPAVRPSNSDPSPADWITLADAARKLGGHRTTVMRLALAGHIRFRTSRGRVLFHRADVAAQAG